MDFEVYCVESAVEAISQKKAHSYSGIGSVWLPKDQRKKLNEGLKEIKAKHKITGEFKWKKISNAFVPFYKELIDFFFNSDFLRARIIIIESNKVDHVKFNNQDAELGFYKFYYQLIKHWLFDFNNYYIFMDLKVNRNKGRLKELEKIL